MTNFHHIQYLGFNPPILRNSNKKYTFTNIDRCVNQPVLYINLSLDFGQKMATF